MNSYLDKTMLLKENREQSIADSVISISDHNELDTSLEETTPTEIKHGSPEVDALAQDEPPPILGASASITEAKDKRTGTPIKGLTSEDGSQELTIDQLSQAARWIKDFPTLPPNSSLKMIP